MGEQKTSKVKIDILFFNGAAQQTVSISLFPQMKDQPEREWSRKVA
jgi:hypothetical protein